MDRRTLGEAIRTARIKRGYTQDQLSELLDITLVHLANIEGARRMPSVPLLLRMMELLDFSVDALVFPERQAGEALHLDGISPQEQEALFRLVEAMRHK